MRPVASSTSGGSATTPDAVSAALRSAALALLVGAVFTLFGVMHSVQLQGGLYWPWALQGHARWLMLNFAGAYVALAATQAALALARERKQEHAFSSKKEEA